MPEDLEEIAAEYDQQDESSEAAQGSNPDTEEVSQEGQGSETQGKQPYTPEEMKALDFEAIDTSRIPAEMMPFYKSMQSAFTRKTQSLAEMRKDINALRESQKKEPEQKFTPQAAHPKEALYQQFKADPVSVIGQINHAISTLERTSQYDDNFVQAREQISNLVALKDELNVRNMVESRQERETVDTVSRLQTAIIEAIPDYRNKAPKLAQFAVDSGLTDADIEYFTHVSHGDRALRLVKAIDNLYSKANAGTSADAKQVKATPNKLERPSGTSTGKASPNLAQAMERAKQTGDWTEVLQLKGAV